MRGRWVLAALALLPVVELAVAIALAGRIGAGWTVLALLLVSAAGLAGPAPRGGAGLAPVHPLGAGRAGPGR